MGVRNIIKSKYKIPVIISEKNKIIFFPLVGLKSNDCIWLNFNKIDNYIKENDFIKVIFFNNYVKKFLCSYTVFNNQINKCSRLIWIYNNQR